MILVDTSVWVDHLRKGDAALANLLEDGQAMIHPWIVGELALGSMAQRDIVLDSLANLPTIDVAKDEEVLSFIERRALYARGIGYVDAHLLASVHLTPNVSLWTRDRALAGVARSLFRLADLT